MGRAGVILLLLSLQVHCEHFNLSYAKCDWPASGFSHPQRFDDKVDAAIDACLASLTQAAPELRKGRKELSGS